MMSQFAASADGCGQRVVALFLLAIATSASAQAAEPLQLTWRAPASCPDAEAVRARVRALVGNSAAAGSQLRAAGTVTRRSDGQYALELITQLDQRVGERKLEARTCEALAGATAVNLALLLQEPPASVGSQESSATDAQGAKPATNETSSPEAAPEPSQNTANASPDDASTSDLRATLQLPRVLIALGPWRAPSFGIALAGGIALDAWTLLAGATWWLPQTEASDRPNTEVTLQHVAASLYVCRGLSFARVGIAPCASVSLEHLRARGVGPFIRSATSDTTWLAAGLGVQARFRLGHWLNALAGAELKLQAARPRIAIAGLGQVAQLGPVAAELFFGAEWIL